MKKILSENLTTTREIVDKVNELIELLSYVYSLIDLEVGTVEPPLVYRRTGMLAYADGDAVDGWDPGSGEGIYYYNAGGTWTKVG